MGFNALPTLDIIKNFNNSKLLDLYNSLIPYDKECMTYNKETNKLKLKRVYNLDEYLRILKEINLNKNIIEIGNGQLAGNKGLKFEKELYLNLIEYINDRLDKNNIYYSYCEDILKAINLNKSDIEYIKHEGKRNSKRNIHINTSLRKDISSVISDITITDKNFREYYLSLKFGNSASFLNISSMKEFFNKELFYERKFTQNMEYFLDLFKVNKDKYFETFKSYNKDAKRRVEVVYPELSLSEKNKIKKILKFDVIGINYYLIKLPEKSNSLYIKNFSEGYINQLLAGDFITTIEYPIENSIKQIKINLIFNNIDLYLVIKNMSGELVPNRLQVNYKIKDNF